LFAVSIAADFTAKHLAIPVPGSILGMIGLTTWFAITGRVDEEVQEAGQVLLRYLALLLVPVGVAVVDLTSGMDGALLKMVGVSVAAMFLATLTTVGTIMMAQKWFRRSVACT
jgi:holin-like protein